MKKPANKVQLYTKKKDDEKIVCVLTGEILTAETDPVILSDIKAKVNLKRRELDKEEKWIDSVLEPLVAKALEEGADTFAEFWQIQRGAMRFNEKAFYAKATPEEIVQYEGAKEAIKFLTDKPEYYKAGKPSLRYPKYEDK